MRTEVKIIQVRFLNQGVLLGRNAMNFSTLKVGDTRIDFSPFEIGFDADDRFMRVIVNTPNKPKFTQLVPLSMVEHIVIED